MPLGRARCLTIKEEQNKVQAEIERQTLTETARKDCRGSFWQDLRDVT